MTGKFTCPYSGIYVFVVTIYKIDLSLPDYTYIYCYIRENGSNLIQVESHVTSDSFESSFESSNFAVIDLVKGDYVDIGYCYIMAKVFTEASSLLSLASYCNALVTKY